MCVTYGQLIHWFRRREILINQMQGYFLKEKHYGGLDKNDVQLFDLLESECQLIESNIENVGINVHGIDIDTIPIHRQ